MELKNEKKLLLDCLVGGEELCRSGRIKAFNPSDWDMVARQALRHSIAPLLYKRLKGLRQASNIPAGLKKTLRQKYLQNTARNVRLYDGVSKILKVLRDADIPVIAIKGIHLAELVYGDIGLRPMVDMDLLVKKEDLSRCQSKLIQAGYYTSHSSFPLDIHWTIDYSVSESRIDMDKVWERAQSTRIMGIDTFILSPEDLFLHLCLHLAFHHLVKFTELKALWDIMETIEHYKGELDWQEVSERAVQWRISNTVSIALMLLIELFKVKLPDIVIETFKPDNIDPAIKSWAIEQMFLDPEDFLNLSPNFWVLLSQVSLKEKIAHLLRLTFTSRKHISQHYYTPCNSMRNYLHYLIRFKNHFPRYMRAIFQMLTHEKKMIDLAKRQNKNIAMTQWLLSN